MQKDPHPNPLPAYQERGPDGHPTYMVVATTRPETMLGDTAVAVHSQDPRWNWAIGKHVRLPLTNRLIPIIADDILVDPKFGTGVVKVTPAHDPNDYAVWNRHKGQADEIDLINILTPDGKITSDRPEWSKYAGMKRAAARTAVVDDLKSAGLLEKEEPYETQVGHSDRSKTPVEPYLSDQWFVKMAPLAEPALQAVREGKIKFYPERHAQQYLSWLGEKRDWPISRQLWWGHRIPVWSAPSKSIQKKLERKTNLITDPGLGTMPAPDNAKSFFFDMESLSKRGAKLSEGERMDFLKRTQSLLSEMKEDPSMQYVCVTPSRPDLEQKLEALGWVQDPDVLDTWFSSALWPHSTLGWPDKTAELSKYYPTSVLLTGRDIITLWVARMVMMGMYNMGNEANGESGTHAIVGSALADADNTPAAAGVLDSTQNGPTPTTDVPRPPRRTLQERNAALVGSAPAPSPLYSGERAGVRGGTSEGAASGQSSTLGPSPQPSPLSTREREQEALVGSALRTDPREMVRNADPTGASLTPSPGTPGEGGG